MQLSSLRSRIQQRKAGGTDVSASRKEPIAYGREMESNAKAKSYKNDNEIAFKNEYNRLNSGYFIEIKKLSHILQLADYDPARYGQDGVSARRRLNEINAEISQRAHAYADSKYPSSGLSGLDAINPQTGTPYITGGGQVIHTTAGACQSMGGTIGGIWSSGGVPAGGYGAQTPDIYECYLQPPPPQRTAPAARVTVSPTINVSPAIQTQVSPQISPAFQQAFQPTGSPMTAGTSQNMPTSQAAAPPVPTYQPPPAPAPTAAPDQSAALLAQQQKMIDLLQSQLQAPQPSAQPLPAPPAAAQIAPPMPQQYAAPLPIQSAAPLPVDQTAPISADTGLPQYGLSTAGQTAAAAFSAQATPPVPATVSTVQPAAQKSNMPMILAILAGAGILFVSMNQKGKRHATR